MQLVTLILTIILLLIIEGKPGMEFRMNFCVKINYLSTTGLYLTSTL